jgi:signal transduction histidine kinase/CheY-like chemotaxis protein
MIVRASTFGGRNCADSTLLVSRFGCEAFLLNRPYRSIASKFFLFTAGLVFWVVAVILAYDLRKETFDVAKGLLLFGVIFLVASAISRMTIRVLAKPLELLQQGIQSVEEGRLEPIQVSATGDEIELLGQGFNRMVAALDASKKELLENQELLEERIRQRTQELERAMQDAMAASAAKSEFLANMSHELRTPMNGVLGMIDMTLATQLTAEQHEHLETAHSCAYSLLALLSDVLDLSKIEAGRMTLEPIPICVRSLAKDAVRAYAVLGSHKGIRVDAEIASDLPAMVRIDPLRLRQIIVNLLSNAIKFTDNGSVRLRISAATLPLPGSRRPVNGTDASRGFGTVLQMEVSDTGMGIARDKLERIFEKFTQADGSVSRRFGGSGLGLTITRSLVELHGGTIRVDSEPGNGSTFTVTLPCEVAARAEPAKPRSLGCILVVDDNGVNRKMVTAILEKAGYSTMIAVDGGEAIDTLHQGGIDLVLMDVQMPVIDGLEVTRRIRALEQWSSLPIVAMTAHAMEGDQEMCLRAGMNGYISKPVHATHLLQTVEVMLTAQDSARPAAHD